MGVSNGALWRIWSREASVQRITVPDGPKLSAIVWPSVLTGEEASTSSIVVAIQRTVLGDYTGGVSESGTQQGI